MMSGSCIDAIFNCKAKQFLSSFYSRQLNKHFIVSDHIAVICSTTSETLLFREDWCEFGLIIFYFGWQISEIKLIFSIILIFYAAIHVYSSKVGPLDPNFFLKD